ncbi:MAG: PilZ domain-containing protein [bacterium]
MTAYQEFIRGFADYGPAAWEIWVSLMAISGLLIFLTVRSFFTQKAVDQRRRRAVIYEFLRVCREKGLLPEEISLLKQYTPATGIPLDSDLIQSNVQFDQMAQQIMAAAHVENVTELNSTLSKLRQRIGFRPPPLGVPLSSTREFGNSQTVYLVFGDSLFLESQITEVDERMFMVRLAAGQPPMPITSDSEIWIFFNRSGDSRYAGQCRILRHTSDEGGHFVILDHCSDLRRDQRRKDFRVEENRDIKIWLLNPQLDELEDACQVIEKHPFETATLDDLSAGGALILFHRNVPINQHVFIDLDPQKKNKLPQVKGTVLRFNRRGRTARWALSIRFDDLRPSERQQIVRYAFQRERDKLNFAAIL